MRFSAFTLVFASLLVLLPASAVAAPGDAIYLNSRDVAHRMIRRRALGSAPVMINRRVTGQNDSGGLLGALFGNGNDGKKTTGDTTSSGTDPSTGDTTTNSTTTTTDPNTGSTNTTDTSGTNNGSSNNNPQNPANPNNGGVSPSVSNTVASTPAVASQSTPSASSTASVASVSSVSTPSPSATLNLSFLPTSTGSFTDPFATDSSATSTATDANASISPSVENKSAFSHTTIVILVVVASCAAAAAIIWTGIRKWKFSPSRQFEDRLQRIDWQPSTQHENQLSAGLGGGFRHGTAGSGAASQRDMSERRTSHGSFGSSDRNHLADNGTDGSVAPDLPPHDFTAGPAAPGATYANLARGPSLTRGASLNRGNTNVTRGPSYGRAYYGGYGTQQQQQQSNNYGYGY